MKTIKAFTRTVSPSIAECALTHLARLPIDAILAAAQHQRYEQALLDAGLDVVGLPELPDYPDGVFVEDTAVLIGDHAIITRPGAASRAGEVASTALGLAEFYEVHAIQSGHLDGGDVLRIGRTLYVGLSSRTDPAGIAELDTVAGRLGFEVVAAELQNCLHLKTAATCAGPDRNGRLVLVYNRNAVSPGQFAGVDAVAVPEDEPGAANVLRAGEHLIVPAGNKRTAELLDKRGFNVVEVEVSELEKAEAGVTCMSLVDGVACTT